MIYTDEQYALLEKIEPGILWPEFSEEERWVYQYLDRDGLLQPREDIKPDLITLSQHGRRVLADYRARQDHLRKEAEQQAEEKRQKKFENKMSVANLLVSVISFLGGVVFEYFFGAAEAAINYIISLFG